jgi:hypothetical protein
MKLLSKLIINSFYGKFGQDNEKYSTTVQCRNLEQLTKTLNNRDYDLDTFDIFYDDPDHIIANVKQKKGRASVSNYQNCFIASLITSFARCKLYDLIHFLDGDCHDPNESNVMYFDTDSVIFKSNETKIKEVVEEFEEGSLLGQLTFEFPRNLKCVEMVALAPKTYSLKLINREDPSKISYYTKAKGFTQNAENSKAINFETMKDAAMSYVKISQMVECDMRTAQSLVHEIYQIIDKCSGTIPKQHLEKFPKKLQKAIKKVIKHKKKFETELSQIKTKWNGKEFGIMNEYLESHALKNKLNEKTKKYAVKILYVFGHQFKKDIKKSTITSIIQSKIIRPKFNKRLLYNYQTDEHNEVFSINTIPYGYTPVTTPVTAPVTTPVTAPVTDRISQ